MKLDWSPHAFIPTGLKVYTMPKALIKNASVTLKLIVPFSLVCLLMLLANSLVSYFTLASHPELASYESVMHSMMVKQSLLVFIIIVIGMAALVTVIRSILAPLREMCVIASEMASGNLNVTVATSNNGDEIDLLAVSLNEMLSNLRNMTQSFTQSLFGIGSVADNLLVTTQQADESAGLQAHAIDKSSKAINSIISSVGDVGDDVQNLYEFAKETQYSITSMAKSKAEDLLKTEALAVSVEDINQSINNIAESIRQVAMGTQNLKSAAFETASSIIEMDSSIKQVQEIAQFTFKIAEGMQAYAHSGSIAMGEVIEGMNQISVTSETTNKIIHDLHKKIESIGSILLIINTFTRQTNMLSLNAGIIAAQSDSSGKGFSVIADQIRDLANMTKSSTDDIAHVISQVQQEAQEAVNAIENTISRVREGEILSKRSSEALSRIVTGINDASMQMEKIFNATFEQSKGSNNICKAIETITTMVDKVAAEAKQQHSSSEHVIVSADRMCSLTEEVRVSSSNQKKLSAAIEESSIKMSAKISQINSSCTNQQRESKEIVTAVNELKESAKLNISVTTVLKESSSEMIEQILRLQDEMSKFKVASESALISDVFFEE
jgi:methyl-accepting chemotaxis protein